MAAVWELDSGRGIVNNNRLPNIDLLKSSLNEYEGRITASTEETISNYIVPVIRHFKTAILCYSLEGNRTELIYITQRVIQIIFDINDKFNLSSIDKIAYRQAVGELLTLKNLFTSFRWPISDDERHILDRRLNSLNRALDAFLELFKVSDVPYIHAFLGDYSRIAFSSSFRRLQDKAQVFPLEKYDYARTRLTHTIEVSGIASQLGNLCALKHFHTDNENKKRMAFLFEKCLMCAALLHDMGNPPFGHFGEDAIRDFFNANLDKLRLTKYTHNPTTDKWSENNSTTLNELFDTTETNEDMKNDLIFFDGNAQSLRVATKAQLYKVGHSLELTAGVLGAIIKYPCTSTQGSKKRKFGYFYSERNVIDQLRCMGVYNDGFRNPLAMLMEAADDISYVTSDLDDAIKKGVLTYADFEHALSKIDEDSPQILIDFKNNFTIFYQENKESDVVSPFEYTIQRMTTDLRIELIKQVVNAFCNNIDTIEKNGVSNNKEESDAEHLLQGSYNELLDCIPYAPFVNWVKNTIFKNYVYNHDCILKAELSGYEIVRSLLEVFTDSILSLNFFKDNDGNFILGGLNCIKHKKVFNLISKNFVDAFKKETDHCVDPNSAEHVYYRLRLIVDHVSGMTDCYAKEMYQIIKGV